MADPQENNETPSRLEACFAELRAQKRPALISYIMAGDPNPKTSAELMKSLVSAGSDVLELGMPFSDPTADGPTIQKAAIRALNAEMTVAKTLEQLYNFRQKDQITPVILMGYFNPILKYGLPEFCKDARLAGADGLIIVDLPPEEDGELYVPAAENGLDIIKLIAPTTNEERMDFVLSKSGGFVYYISLAGTTGTKSVNPSTILPNIKKVRRHTDLPIAVGFGVKTPEQAQEIGKFADGIVVGSAIVEIIEKNTKPAKGIQHQVVTKVFDFAESLSKAIHSTEKLY